jgi:hypothetical protein
LADDESNPSVFGTMLQVATRARARISVDFMMPCVVAALNVLVLDSLNQRKMVRGRTMMDW